MDDANAFVAADYAVFGTTLFVSLAIGVGASFIVRQWLGSFRLYGWQWASLSAACGHVHADDVGALFSVAGVHSRDVPLWQPVHHRDLELPDCHAHSHGPGGATDVPTEAGQCLPGRCS